MCTGALLLTVCARCPPANCVHSSPHADGVHWRPPVDGVRSCPPANVQLCRRQSRNDRNCKGNASSHPPPLACCHRSGGRHQGAAGGGRVLRAHAQPTALQHNGRCGVWARARWGKELVGVGCSAVAEGVAKLDAA
eukprot:118310-Chlamydomonas_euryale.AAC.9